MMRIINAGVGWLLVLGRASLKLVQYVKALLGIKRGWTGLKRWMLQVVTLGCLVATGGFLVAALGLIPIKASSGHWPITAWFLHFTMIRSVSTHTIGVEVPELDRPGMVLKGANHYATGCFPCHGDPSTKHPHIAMQMTPHPPYLPPIVDQWEPEELFYIVKHGVKFTGMPAWPAQERDDEVWAMVAFLKKFPDLRDQDYASMVHVESKADGGYLPLEGLSGRNGTAQWSIESCDRCHGSDGQGREAGLAPKLAGQKYEYLEASLEAYSQGNRHSGIMEPIAVAMSREVRREIAQHYSKFEAVQESLPSKVDLASIRRGETIALKGVAKARIPICAECHGPGDNPSNEAYPNLAGQYADYLMLQLELFASGSRGGSDFASLMHPFADQLTSEQMRDVALYYESLSEKNYQPTK